MYLRLSFSPEVDCPLFRLVKCLLDIIVTLKTNVSKGKNEENGN